MAGFDMQVTADGTRERFAQDLRAFAAALRDPSLRKQATLLVNQALAARDRLFASKFTASADLVALTEATLGLRALIQARRAAFEEVWDALDTSFMAHAVENARADAAMRFESARAPTTPERENRREALNAANLRWLLAERYAGRKAVVWAHNAHVMNAFYAPGFHKVRLAPRPGDMKPMGVFLKDSLGDEVYTLGMTTFEGREGLATGGPISQIPPAPDGSLEARLHALGWLYAFVDFRASRRDRSSPIRGPQTIRVPKFETSTVSDIARVYDGMFFIDRMSPATGL
jgi:erythromycin esterase-like protein